MIDFFFISICRFKVFNLLKARDHIYKEIVDKAVECIKKQEIANNCSKSKIVIEISNRPEDERIADAKTSNAQKLNEMFMEKLAEIDYKVHVVKGFNLLDAYSLISSINKVGTNQFFDKSDLVSSNLVVPLCCNEPTAKLAVANLCSRIGLRAYDLGKLDSSIKLELANQTTFNNWFYPSIYSLFLLVVTFVIMFFTNFLFPKKPLTFTEYLNNFSPLSHLNKVLGYTSLQQLAFIYLASVFAGIYQLKYGTKYRRFPPYLDYWLNVGSLYGKLRCLFFIKKCRLNPRCFFNFHFTVS